TADFGRPLQILAAVPPSPAATPGHGVAYRDRRRKHMRLAGSLIAGATWTVHNRITASACRAAHRPRAPCKKCTEERPHENQSQAVFDRGGDRRRRTACGCAGAAWRADRG